MGETREERFQEYVHPTNQPKFEIGRRRYGVIDAYSAIAYQRVSNSRFAISGTSQPLALSTDYGPTPYIPGVNSYPLQLEESTELYDLAAMEQYFFAVTERSGSGISNSYLYSWDGTYPRVINKFTSTATSQIRIDAIIYSSYFRTVIVGGYDLLAGTPVAYQFAEAGMTNLSGSLPAGNWQFYDGFFSALAGKFYFLTDNGGAGLLSYDGTTWVNEGSVSGTPVAIDGPVLNPGDCGDIAVNGLVYLATMSSLYSWLGSFTLEQSVGGTISDLRAVSGAAYATELNGTTATVWKRAGATWANHSTFTNASQIALGVEIFMESLTVSYFYALVADSTAPTKTVTIYRNTGTTWSNEGSIYTGGKFNSTANIGVAPFYMTSNRRFAFKAMHSLRDHLILMLPYSNTSPATLPGDGIDIWSRRTDIGHDPVWYHEKRFIGPVLSNDSTTTVPSFTARAF